MPDVVIAQVHHLSQSQKNDPGLLFLDHNEQGDDNPVDDNDNDSDYNPESDDQSYDSESDDEDDEATRSNESDNQPEEWADDMTLPDEEDPAEVQPHDDDPAEDHNLVENSGVEQHEMGDAAPENEVVEIPGVDTQSDDGNDEADADDCDPEEQTDQNNQWYEL